MKSLLPVILVSLVSLTACGGYPIDTTMSEEVPDFEYTNQDNETFSLEDLEGKWWIADFVFTNCTTVCLPMTSNMAKLQEQLKEEGLDVHHVTFSVDLEYDSLEVLKNYGEGYGADFSNWTFLTGYSFDEIKELSIKTFKSMLAEPPEGSDQVTHGINFFLVSPDGEVIKNYNGTDSKQLASIVHDLKEIQK